MMRRRGKKKRKKETRVRVIDRFRSLFERAPHFRGRKKKRNQKIKRLQLYKSSKKKNRMPLPLAARSVYHHAIFARAGGRKKNRHVQRIRKDSASKDINCRSLYTRELEQNDKRKRRLASSSVDRHRIVERVNRANATVGDFLAGGRASPEVVKR